MRGTGGSVAQGELWTAISTPSFARAILAHAHASEPGDSRPGGAAAAAATQVMSQEVARLFAPYFGQEPSAVPVRTRRAPRTVMAPTPFTFARSLTAAFRTLALQAPLAAAAKRWGAAFADGSCELREGAVGLEPWRVAIAGDYLQRQPSPVEAAASSGLEAGERVASWFQSDPEGEA